MTYNEKALKNALLFRSVNYFQYTKGEQDVGDEGPSIKVSGTKEVINW